MESELCFWGQGYLFVPFGVSQYIPGVQGHLWRVIRDLGGSGVTFWGSGGIFGGLTIAFWVPQ